MISQGSIWLNSAGDWFRWVVASLAALNAGFYLFMLPVMRKSIEQPYRRVAWMFAIGTIAMFTAMNSFGRIQSISIDAPFTWQDFVWLAANILALYTLTKIGVVARKRV